MTEHEYNPNDLMRQMEQVLQYGSIEQLESLFDGGMDINQTDFQGRTALQLMAFKGNLEAVEMLIRRGADVNAVFKYQDRIPMTALDAAKQGNKKEVVDILLAHGAMSGKELQE